MLPGHKNRQVPGRKKALVKVIDESHKGVSEGTEVPLEEVGLPAPTTGGLLIVFWKGQ